MKQKKKEHPNKKKWFCSVNTVQSKIGKRTTGWNRKPNSENSKFPLFAFVIKKTEVWDVTTQNSYNKRIKKKKKNPLIWRWNHGWRLEVSFGFKLTRDWKKAAGDYWKTTWRILYVWMRDRSILFCRRIENGLLFGMFWFWSDWIANYTMMSQKSLLYNKWEGARDLCKARLWTYHQIQHKIVSYGGWDPSTH